jgi:hypothetical protein
MKWMRWAGFGLALVLAPAQTRRTVDDLVSYIKTAIEKKYKDADVAASLQSMKLANRLDEATVVELQRMGAGQKTVAVLRRLSEGSASLPAAAAPVVKAEPSTPPPPSPGQVKEILAEVRENSLNYTKSLPNYLCTQVTRRRVDPGTGSWHDTDRIVEQLSFFEQKETYKVKMVNDSMVTDNRQHEQLGGAVSSGEFGSILRAVFAPETETEFAWERWGGLRGHWQYVFSFHTIQPMYTITHDNSKRTVHVRTRGLIFADRDTRMVMRLHLETEGIPSDFPIQNVTLDQDYDFTDIAGQQFMLPLHSNVRSREGRFQSWNEVTYLAYHKYGAEATITFDSTELPPDKLKEEKPKK